MEGFKNEITVEGDVIGNKNSNVIELSSNNDEPMDLKNFEKLDSSPDSLIGLNLEGVYGKEPLDIMSENSQFASFKSTTRPLVTSAEEIDMLGLVPTTGSVHFSDKSKVNEDSLNVDINMKRSDDVTAVKGALDREQTDDALSISKETRGVVGDANTQRIGAVTGDSSVSADKVYETKVQELLPNLKDPKIDTKLVSGSEYTGELKFSAYESIAQLSSVKSEPAMESATIGTVDCKEESCPFSPGSWFNPEKLHPSIADYVYWRDVKKSGVAFGASLVLLLSITYFSLISVFAYVALAALSATISFRIYKNVLQAVQKSNEGHPFKDYLEMDINLSPEKAREIADAIVHHANCATNKFRSYFLVEDLVDSIKLGVLLWCLTYIGAWFNGMTLVILALVFVFTLPKVYETYKVQIDHYLELTCSQVKEIIGKINAKIPLFKKKKE